jgi:hypothetical protein
VEAIPEQLFTFFVLQYMCVEKGLSKVQELVVILDHFASFAHGELH